MLGGREKVGGGVVDISMATMPKKNRRLTFPFGPETTAVDGRDTIHEHNIREIPLAIGALGCALWDGGLVLTRWLYQHGEAVFRGGNARVLELGCGVGLAGIMAAHFAQSCVLTDYIPDALGNCVYNVKLNDLPASDDSRVVPEEFGAKLRPSYRFDIGSRVSVEYLDWDAELARQQHNKEATAQQQPPKKVDDLPEGVKMFDHPPRSFDVILGAELTYNLLSCEALARVVDTFLADDGVFIEVLSKDRDGVSVFIQKIEALGFVTDRQDAPVELQCKYGTRKWSKQEDERYSIFRWSRTKKAKNGAAAAAAAAAADDE